MKTRLFLPVLFIITSLACNLSPSSPVSPPPEQTTPTSPASPSQMVPINDPAINIPDETDLIRQGAVRSLLEPYSADAIALGDYDEESTSCGADYLASTPAEDGQILLSLGYWQALLPEGLELFIGPQPDGIEYIEVLNSTSGLGKLIYEDSQPITRQALEIGSCQQLLKIPFQTDFEIDTVFITFKNPQAVWQLASVEMLGRLNAYTELPVFWRVPLPGTPAGLAVSKNSLVFAASEPNSLFAYDFEGNQLEQFSVPNEAFLTDVAADNFGNLVIVDDIYGWFIVISPEGEHLTIGGESVFGEAAVSPLDGNLYLLMGSQVHVYTMDTGEFLRLMPLDDLHTHTSLAFTPDGRLFTLQDFDWEPKLLELDTLTGHELDTISVERSRSVDIVASDLAIDAVGNFYILFRMNTADIAVHILDPNGTLVRRFGKLTFDTIERTEGVFFEPRAIAVSPDGRLIFIADGFDNEAALTAYRLETEQ